MGSLTPILNVMPVTHFRKAVLTVLRNWINISFMYIYIYIWYVFKINHINGLKHVIVGVKVLGMGGWMILRMSLSV